MANLKNNLSRYLEYVRSGGRIVVYRRKEPVAEIGPPRPTPGTGMEHERLQALERKGILRLGSGEIPQELRTPQTGPETRLLDPAARVDSATGRRG